MNPSHAKWLDVCSTAGPLRIAAFLGEHKVPESLRDRLVVQAAYRGEEFLSLFLAGPNQRVKIECIDLCVYSGYESALKTLLLFDRDKLPPITELTRSFSRFASFSSFWPLPLLHDIGVRPENCPEPIRVDLAIQRSQSDRIPGWLLARGFSIRTSDTNWNRRNAVQATLRAATPLPDELIALCGSFCFDP